MFHIICTIIFLCCNNEVWFYKSKNFIRSELKCVRNAVVAPNCLLQMERVLGGKYLALTLYGVKKILFVKQVA